DTGDAGCIVVAIDNGGSERLNEYSPWAIPDYGVEGKGENYIDFIVETLKPFIDANYRTKSDREFTGIMGSSMGALISTYGGIEHRETFSRIGAFSPSYWITDSCFLHVAETPHDAPMRVYSIGGELEGSSMITHLNTMDATFAAAGYESDEFKTVTHPDGQHSEWYWAREFENAYLWLWSDVTQLEQTMPSDYFFKIYPNPAADFVEIGYSNSSDIQSITISDMSGRAVMHFNGCQKQVPVHALSAGLYTVQVELKNGMILKEIFVRL
ncbi:MAG: alpha/beta hydrolase-fold protein, partial [Chitinophagales bacterium]